MEKENFNNLENSGKLNNYNPKNQKYITIIIVIVIIILLVYSFYENNISDFENLENEETEEYLSYEEKENIEKEKFEEQKSNIKISSQGLDINKKLILLLENQNTDNISNFSVYVIFYDGENNPVMVDIENIKILEKDVKHYVTIDKTPENFESYDFLIVKEYFNDNYISYRKDISFETHKDKDNIIIDGKNNSSTEIDNIEFTVIYYDESGKVIGIKEANEYDVGKNKNFSIEVYNLYKKDTYEDIEYASYDVILNGAYKY